MAVEESLAMLLLFFTLKNGGDKRAVFLSLVVALSAHLVRGFMLREIKWIKIRVNTSFIPKPARRMIIR